MTDGNSQQDRLELLKAERALFGLSEQDSMELDQLSTKFVNQDVEDMDRVAAILTMLMHPSQNESMPKTLRTAIKTEATEFFATTTPEKISHPTAERRVRRGWYSWGITAACCAIAVVIGFLVGSSDRSPDQSRASLLASANDLIRVDWSPGPNQIADVSGDVIWSPSQQTGYMRFLDLPVNDPTKEQYQLWIFAKNQSEATPIDGGVFDIDRQGEVVVPIDAKLYAEDAYLFAVTVEQPGGVVVSSRENLPLLAQVN